MENPNQNMVATINRPAHHTDHCNENKNNDLCGTDSVSSKIKMALLEIVLASSSHGLPSIFRTKRLCIKTMWTLSVLLAIGLCSYMSISGIIDYLQFDTVTKIYVNYENPTLFPTITVCNINPFLTMKSAQLIDKLINETGYNNLLDDSLFGSLEYNNLTLSKARLLVYKYWFMFNILDPNLTIESKRSLAHQPDDFIISCIYNLYGCSSKDFEWFFNPEYGNCYKFNSGFNSKGERVPIRESTRPGKLNALELELFIGSSQDKYEMIQSTGAVVFVNNASFYPYYFQNFELSTGFMTSLAINKVFYKKLPKPYSDCEEKFVKSSTFDPLLFNVLKSDNRAYSQRDCIALCQQLDTISSCGCYEPSVNSLNFKKPCRSLKELSCVFNIHLEFVKTSHYEKCKKYCPLECNTVTYDLLTSISSFPTKFYGNVILNKTPSIYRILNKTEISHEELKDNVLGLNIYYDELKYTTIEELEHATFIDLIANLGGYFGLFLGASLLTFVELLEAGLEIIFILYENRKRNDVVEDF